MFYINVHYCYCVSMTAMDKSTNPMFMLSTSVLRRHQEIIHEIAFFLLLSMQPTYNWHKIRKHLVNSNLHKERVMPPSDRLHFSGAYVTVTSRYM